MHAGDYFGTALLLLMSLLLACEFRSSNRIFQTRRFDRRQRDRTDGTLRNIRDTERDLEIGINEHHLVWRGGGGGDWKRRRKKKMANVVKIILSF